MPEKSKRVNAVMYMVFIKLIDWVGGGGSVSNLGQGEDKTKSSAIVRQPCPVSLSPTTAFLRGSMHFAIYSDNYLLFSTEQSILLTFFLTVPHSKYPYAKGLKIG